MPYRKFCLPVFLTLCSGISRIAQAQSALAIPHSKSLIPLSGKWKGNILREDGNRIPVYFELQRKSEKYILYILNGAERLLVDDVHWQGDSLFINLPFFDSRFASRIEDSTHLSGKYIKNYGNRIVEIPFQAVYARADLQGREMKPAPRFDISGRWSVVFVAPGDTTIAVGEFKQQGARVTGTFMTITGDYRFLSGDVQGDTLRLSTFDGGHAYAFVSKILSAEKMSGFFYAGATSTQSWTAEKNNQARLPDEYSLTKLKDPTKGRLHFSYRDLNGNMVSLADPKYKNKVVVIQILGSWCPNCMDETRYLAPWYKQNKSRGVELIGLAYERTPSYADAQRLLKPFVQRFQVSYPILPTGVTVGDPERTEKTLPEIDSLIGFPTTIFIDKKGNVRRISTGFNGPGTGEHYEAYKKDFNELVNSLLSE